jgi:hypothetical protein
LAGAGGAFYYLYWDRANPAPAPRAAAAPIAEAPRAEPSPAIRFPVTPEAEPATEAAGKSARKGLPAVDESDPSLEESLRAIVDQELASLFVFKDFVRRIVGVVDAATGHKQPSGDRLPVTPPDSSFAVAGKKGQRVISPANFKRYRPYVGLIEKTDLRKLVALYVHYYPLFQSAYLDLGMPGYFNDRLVDALDNLIATPEIQGAIPVGRPSLNGRYKFSDEVLESLSMSQKLLIRMGPQNERIVKAKARQLRAMLAHLGKPGR